MAKVGDEEPVGWIIESRLPILGDEWELCKMHGHTPEEGFTELQACRIAASLVKTTSTFGPEIQWRIIDNEGTEIGRESNRK